MERGDTFALNLKVKLVATLLRIERYTNMPKVAYYTIHVQGRPLDEFNFFLKEMRHKMKNRNELGQLLQLINNMGQHWGYHHRYFKKEENGHRFLFPSDNYTDENSPFGVRLYCKILSPEIIVLTGGCLKTQKKVSQCNNCQPYFELNNRVAIALEKAINNNYIELDGMDILQDEEFELVI